MTTLSIALAPAADMRLIIGWESLLLLMPPVPPLWVLAPLGAPWLGRLLMTSSTLMPVMVSCGIANSPFICKHLVWHLSVPRKNMASAGGNRKGPSMPLVHFLGVYGHLSKSRFFLMVV